MHTAKLQMARVVWIRNTAPIEVPMLFFCMSSILRKVHKCILSHILFKNHKENGGILHFMLYYGAILTWKQCIIQAPYRGTRSAHTIALSLSLPADV